MWWGKIVSSIESYKVRYRFYIQSPFSNDPSSSVPRTTLRRSLDVGTVLLDPRSVRRTWFQETSPSVDLLLPPTTGTYVSGYTS